jgi:hypothetical protein
MIYEIILVRESQPDFQTHAQAMSNFFNPNALGPGDLPRPGPIHPAILRTNNQIHLEAASILYGNTWVLWEVIQILGTSTPKRCPPLSYTRLCQRLHLSLSCFTSFQLRDRDLEAMRLSVKEMVEALQHNNIKELIISVEFWQNSRRDWNASDFRRAGNLILKPFEMLKGVTNICICVGPLKNKEHVRELTEMMKRPRSREEEAARIKGWLDLGDWEFRLPKTPEAEEESGDKAESDNEEESGEDDGIVDDERVED